MSPIRGLSENQRLPRLGKIRLGAKAISPKTGKEYPKALEYFNCPDAVKSVYGEQPKRLEVLIPVEDDEVWANQYYRRYSSERGLVCKGDGETCRRMVDSATGETTAKRTTKEVAWKEGLRCEGRECADYKAKKCQEVMNLQFLLPKVPGLGIWQIDTGSINSIRNVNNAAMMVRAACGRVSWVPLVLTLEPTEVVNPDDGKKKTVHCLNLRYEGDLQQLLIAATKPRVEVLIAAPSDDELPDDATTNGHLLTTPTATAKATAAMTDAEVAAMWGGGTAEAPKHSDKFIATTPAPQSAPVSIATSETTPQNVPGEKKKLPHDPASIKDRNTFQKWCSVDFDLHSPRDICRELNVDAITLIADYGEAYTTIGAARGYVA